MYLVFPLCVHMSWWKVLMEPEESCPFKKEKKLRSPAGCFLWFYICVHMSWWKVLMEPESCWLLSVVRLVFLGWQFDAKVNQVIFWKLFSVWSFSFCVVIPPTFRDVFSNSPVFYSSYFWSFHIFSHHLTFWKAYVSHSLIVPIVSLVVLTFVVYECI